MVQSHATIKMFIKGGTYVCKFMSSQKKKEEIFFSSPAQLLSSWECTEGEG